MAEDVTLTHLDEPLFDEAGATKRDLVEYLEAVSGFILPELRDRPLSVIRVRAGQRPFMQKNLPEAAPPWIRFVTLWAESSHREVRYALCDDWRTLLWFANQRAVEYHPTLVLAGQKDRPTQVILDIDPPEGGPFGQAVAAAFLVRQALADAGLAGAVKTSGSKGVHVYVPVEGATSAEAAAATRALAARAERLDPALATTAFIRADREGKVFLDSTRAGGATVAAAYSPRVRPGVPVSFPVRWEDLDGVLPADFTVHTVPGLLGGHAAWAGQMPAPQRLSEELAEEGRAIPIARVQAMHEGKRRARARRESLALYVPGTQRSLMSGQPGGGPGSSGLSLARRPSRTSARYRWRSSAVRSGLATLTAAISSKASETSCRTTSGRSVPRTRPNSSSMSLLDRLARANSSGVGANRPARARVIELVSASTRLRMKVDQVAHETGEDLPAVLALAELADGVLRLLDDDHQAVGAERAEELFLASVAGVQRADADAGVLGDRGDRRTRQSARASEDTTPRRLALNAVTGGPQGLERPDRWNIGPVTDGPMEHWAGSDRGAGPSSGPDVAGADESAGPVESVRPVGWRGCGCGGGGVGRCCGRDAEASREPVRALGSAGHRAAGVCRSALEASGPAWTASGDAAQVTTPLPQGPMAPADAAGAAALDASAGHAWDIAMATGQGSPLTPELALSLMPVAKSIVEPLRAYRVYAQALEAGADDAAVLLCYLGRRPDWKA